LPTRHGIAEIAWKVAAGGVGGAGTRTNDALARTARARGFL
jgi:hypothetical protein